MGSLPEQLVAEFLREHWASGTYLHDHITRLSELATSEDTEVAESATRAVFTSLVERLADSFDKEAVSLYNRAFAQLIQSCRERAHGEPVDRALAEFGLRSEEDLIARAEKLRHVPVLSTRKATKTVQRVVVLSRVTLGADVAITSVILERMKRNFPSAEIVLLGGSKGTELFGGDSRITFKEIDYRRAGPTIERLLSWIPLIDCLQDLTSDLQTQYLIVDPDTRLTQLGLLPITNDAERYLFFPSREYGSDTSQSLGELTSCWLDEVIGEELPTFPCISLSTADIQAARDLAGRIKRGSSRRIVALNFGVGEKQMKRVSDEFETSLTARLIQEGAVVVLDKGAGDEEIRRAEAIITHSTSVEREGQRVRALELNEENLQLKGADSNRLDVDLVTWHGRIGVLAALIGESDLYIGYDSAGQHIAAALGVPAIDVFAGFSSTRMLERWRPTGKSETRIVAVNTLSGYVDANAVFFDVLRHAKALLRNN